MYRTVIIGDTDGDCVPVRLVPVDYLRNLKPIGYWWEGHYVPLEEVD